MKFLFIIFILGTVLVFRFYDFFTHQPHYQNGQKIQVKTTLQEEPELSNKGQRFSFKTPANQRMYVTANAFPRYHYGDVVHISGILQEKNLPDGRSFFSLYYPQISVRVEGNNSIAYWAKFVRERSRQVYEQTLPPTSASLLMGIVFGAKEHFSDAFFDKLRATGVLHVIAASGMNVTFVAAALIYTFGLFMRRQLALVLGCVGIIFYVFLVGFEPSILRAAIMALLGFGASLLGKQNFATFTVLMSGYMMLLFQPAFLFDLGFQLSFLATLGILYGKPLITLPENIFTESITTTFAAQVGTLPILLGVFGKFGLLSFLVNALVLWTVPAMMLLGSLAAVCSLLIPPLAQVFLWFCLPFLLFFESVVSFFGGSQWVIQLPHLPVVIWIGYYLLLASWVLLKKKRLHPVEEKKVIFTTL